VGKLSTLNGCVKVIGYFEVQAMFTKPYLQPMPWVFFILIYCVLLAFFMGIND
jgi:hypothetical protein